MGAALGTGLPFEQCRILLFQMERDGQLHVYADHYRLKVLPAPTPVAALRDLPAPAFHALTRNPQLADLLEDRWNEAELLARTPAHRMALIAYGAVLEGRSWLLCRTILVWRTSRWPLRKSVIAVNQNPSMIGP